MDSRDCSETAQPIAKFEFTPRAGDVVNRVYQDVQKRLVMVISSGCCDGTAPYLYSDYIPASGSKVVYKDDIVEVVVADNFVEWPNLVVQIDVDETPLSDSFSLESDYGYRFVIRYSGEGAFLPGT